MKDILVLLFLLNAQTIKVCSQPYQPDSEGSCLNKVTEYFSDDSNLCCKKCPPGQHRKQECSETTETVCEQCPEGTYMESSNYYKNCFSCKKCKPVKGLQNLQNCTSTTKSKCGCKPGMFCIVGFDDPYCDECRKYKPCNRGYGVSVQGTADSDVKCEPCPNGTFSDTISYTDRCHPHTNCHGRVIVRKADATSDTVCGPEAIASSSRPQTLTKDPHTAIVFTTASTTNGTVSVTSDSRALHEVTDSTQTPSDSDIFSHSTTSPPPSPETTVIAIVTGLIGLLLFIIIILALCCKPVWKKDAAKLHPKVDANGNCETGDEVNQGFLGETQLTSFKVSSPEQQLLLKSESCSSNNTEPLTRTDGDTIYDSTCPLQTTIAPNNPLSLMSEPMSLHSNIEPLTPQTSLPTQSSSQPTSPQIISPMTTSPHVNVNITFNIGGTPSIMSTDLMQVDSKLPFGEEEKSFSIPQQEDGKRSLTSVQESTSCSA
ncbi:tumor necrosis factor receptor superfamily member 1B isoform X2 [Dicentrarchus labrax]|uniref:tumor necrosis factor receptor superfamily member 1B isoform X2 n=1 Tax=Dicentrarchus labrax TaxID=13489 RepID=UPI0021F690D5|nr:tumor necrosis factor receptor superfamily member 1B isoform X2 [Dicentrarchus labrax]